MVANNKCLCGFFIKELDEELYKTETKIRTIDDKSTEDDWVDIEANVDRIKMAMNTAEQECGINAKSAKAAYNRLVPSLPNIMTEQGRKSSIGIINRIHFEIYHSLDDCIDTEKRSNKHE